MLAEPPHQRGDVRRDAQRMREHGRIFGGQLVDDGQPRVDGRAVLGIDRSVDGGGEDHAATLLQAGERRSPGRIVGREAGGGDCDQAAAGREARERRGDMAERSIGDAALDMRHDRERRIHQHDARHGGGIEMIVDLGRVEAGDGIGRKEGGKQVGAQLRQLVQNEPAARDLGEDGEKSGACRRLQHAVSRRDGGGMGRGQAKRDRG